jgi:hypothetical protein
LKWSESNNWSLVEVPEYTAWFNFEEKLKSDRLDMQGLSGEFLDDNAPIPDNVGDRYELELFILAKALGAGSTSNNVAYSPVDYDAFVDSLIFKFGFPVEKIGTQGFVDNAALRLELSQRATDYVEEFIAIKKTATSEWEEEQAIQMQMILSKLLTLSGGNEAVEAKVSTMERGFSSNPFFAKIGFEDNVTRLKELYGDGLTEGETEAFLKLFKKLVDHRVDAFSDVNNAESLASARIKELVDWFSINVVSDSVISGNLIAGETIYDLVFRLSQPVSTEELVNRFVGISQERIIFSYFATLTKNLYETLLKRAGQLSSSQVMVIKKAKAILEKKFKDNFKDMDLITMVEVDGIDDFTTFCKNRRVEVDQMTDASGLWKVNAIGEASLFDEEHLSLYNFWNLLKRHDDWYSNFALKKHLYPLRTLLRQVRASAENLKNVFARTDAHLSGVYSKMISEVKAEEVKVENAFTVLRG